MSKKTPWWRKPRKKDVDGPDNYDDDLDRFDNDNYERHFNSRRPNDNDRIYGRHPEDWEPEVTRRGIRGFDDDLESFFSRPSFGFRDDVFSDLEQEFSEMNKRMDRLFRQATEGRLQPGEGGPFVYGFSMRTGPDGVPEVKEFGNIPPELRSRFRHSNTLPFRPQGELSEGCSSCNTDPSSGVCTPNQSRERRRVNNDTSYTQKPLTDVLDCGDHISITVELPGVEKNDIILEIIDNKLEINVESPTRKYYDKIPLPDQVEPDTISASLKNGVLEVCVNRLNPKKKKGKKIDIN